MVLEYILWGATGQALMVEDCLAPSGAKLLAVFDNNLNIRSPFTGIPIYYGERGLQQWLENRSNPLSSVMAFVAVGGGKGKERLGLQRKLKGHGFTMGKAVHRTAYIAPSAVLGEGCQILPHAVVCAGAILGDACIVNTRSSVDHGCIIGDAVHIAPGAILTGEIKVGMESFIGAGAVVLPHLEIGRGAWIGAGAVVTKNVPDRALVVGNPARFVRFL